MFILFESGRYINPPLLIKVESSTGWEHPIKINKSNGSSFFIITLQFTKCYVLSIDFFGFVEMKIVIRRLSIG